MKKIFKYIGMISIVLLSFFYTEKTTLVVREYDELMVKIRKIENEITNPKEAIIKDNTIIPGISGKKINVKESYFKMKQINKYDENLLVYDKIYPNEILKNNKDKYIINGNQNKRMVSIIVLVDKNMDKLIKYKNINLFINKIETLENKKNIIGYYEYDEWIHSTLKANGIDIKYCLNDLNCLNNFYTIKTDIIKNNYLFNTKKVIKNGSILVYKDSEELIKELNIIINFIECKGYTIEYLDTLLEE